MPSLAIKTLLSGKIKEKTPVELCGWVKTRRDSKAGMSFLNVNDGSCFAPLQVVVSKELPNYESDVLKLTAGCSVKISGELVKSPGKEQAFEVHAKSVEVVGFVEDPDTYPISPKHHTLEYLREHAHLRPRTNVMGAMSRVRTCVAQAIHEFFYKEGFHWVPTPIITGSDCEGAGEMFRVSTLDLLNLPHTDKGQIDFSQEFFGKETFLTVSGQLNAEAYACALSKVYTFGPTFRAENSNTSRHLSEFWMIEPEIAFADVHDDAKLAIDMLKYIIKKVLDDRQDDMAFFDECILKGSVARLEKFIESDFVEMTYTDAIKILEKSKKSFEFPVHWGVDLQSEHERYLTEEHVGQPVILIDYPKEIKAFYMRLNDDQKTVAAMDVLAPGVGEIIGGSQREERLDVLEQRMKEMELDDFAAYSWYLDLRRYGTVPHAGFGLGFERFLAYVTGMSNIRDAMPFPRTPKHAEY